MTLTILELGRSTTALQEFSANQAEKSIAQEKSFTRSISCADEGNFPSASDSYLDYATFQKEFVEIIPENWTVISISLSENRDELRLSKLCWRQDPFIVVIPLNRHNSRDADEEIFDFEQGKAELSGIIELANYSTHDERDFSKKGAKTEWWEARAALDARLQDLLVNIENVWLGGFRGLFRQQCRRPGLLSRFKQSFDKILDTHLPSRRRIGRVGKNSTANRVDLDPHVLELIIGLGNPNDANDLDEPLLDLLYFVIDILQFHGERNAYDEIDFDAVSQYILLAKALLNFVLDDSGNTRCPPPVSPSPRARVSERTTDPHNPNSRQSSPRLPLGVFAMPQGPSGHSTTFTCSSSITHSRYAETSVQCRFRGTCRPARRFA